MAIGGMAAIVVVGEQYCAPFEVELTVTKKVMSLSGGSFEVTDGEGQLLFQMDGHAFSLRDKRVLLDASGRPILTAHRKLASMHDTWKVSLGENFNEESKLFTVKKATIFQWKTNLKVFLTSNSNEECPDFTIKGNFFERESKIYQGDIEIAQLKRKFTMQNLLLDKRTFHIVVSPRTDQAFIATLVVIMDSIYEEENG